MNKIILGHAKTELPKLPPESVNCCVCSPPYWGLRDYGIEPVIWDGDKDCEHEWGNKRKIPKTTQWNTGGVFDPNNRKTVQEESYIGQFCLKCGAWRGSLGLEPTFELYIKHLCDIFDEVKRVLRKDGTCWVNLGDTYWGGGQGGNDYGGKFVIPSTTFGHIAKGNGYQAKSLTLIPQRFAIEMVNRGWILRNTIIWHKPNCMPSSAKDRFTVDFEYVFFFTKSNKALFWTNEKTLECVRKSPLGTKGIEGKDWEWRPCPRCQGTGGETKINKKDAENMGSPRARYHRITKQEICKRCKGLGKVKVSLWTGHDYWFEQQFEELNYDSFRETKRGFNQPKGNRQEGIDNWKLNPQGRNKRAVWTVPTQPFPEAHFAVYPEGLIEIPIKAGCPEFVCKKCGKARVKILEPTEEYKKFLGKGWHDHLDDLGKGFGQQTREFSSRKGNVNGVKRYRETGYTDCGCNAGFEGGIVLDPFIGAGTTAVVAKKLGRNYLGIEIKQEYIDMANKRIRKIPELLF